MTTSQPTLEHTRNQHARQQAMAAVEGLPVAPSGSVTYTSRGRVLVIGGEEAYWLASRITPPLHAELLLTGGDQESGVPTTPLADRTIELSGHLGAFVVELGEPGHHNHQRLQVDLVLDLSPAPLNAAELPPPGYWHVGTEPADIDAALVAVDGMLGTFEKPRYFAYDAAICAHARSGRDGCRQCIDACPAEAIISIGEKVEVNPNLCQGGGICATVCPTGAMRYAYPAAVDTATRLRRMLVTYTEAGGSNPIVMFAADVDAADIATTPSNVLLIAIEELASVGHEIWLAALAWGARAVILVDGASIPPRARSALTDQIMTAQALLEGMGYPGTALRLTAPDELDANWQTIDGLPEAARFAATGDKRQLAAMALDHLWQHSHTPAAWFDMPASSPYGRIAVDTQRCTLCMACTSVCPAKALSAGDEVPRLDFFEGNCVQCGICANACPEEAITLHPRYLADPAQRRVAQKLHEDEPFCCIACGKPFATRRVIDNILEKLAGHAMFQGERARQRLRMCEDCRVVDAVQDADAMEAGLTLHDNHRNGNG
ncbi:MAG: 4Fe-4S binding protein [Gammaproteobacteria bacterium]|nr:4Fe-4S binding protein [Gammaproteobacteria bacterium]